MLSHAFTVVLLILPGGKVVAQNAADSPKPYTMAQVWTLDATYTDAQHGVTFRYPSVWKAGTEFGYHPGALAMATPIAGFGFEEDGFPRDRPRGPYAKNNVEGFGILYSAVAAASSRACEDSATGVVGDYAGGKDTSPPKHVVFGGRRFSDRQIAEAGMSQSTSGELYATWAKGTCYLFEIDLSMASIGALDDIDELTSAQADEIWRRLTGIMKTVRIAPHP
jgi:hypothetical protein